MPASESKVDTTRDDPYKHYRFRVMWDNQYVAGISRVSGLTRTTPVVTHRSGADPGTPRRLPGQSEYAPITLERGVTHDMNFEQWCSKVWNYANSLKGDFDGANQVISLKDFRKDIVLQMFNEAGQLAVSYKIYRCWVSEYQAMPELDASGNSVAIQTIKLENEGWDRDDTITEPTAPGFSLPAATP